MVFSKTNTNNIASMTKYSIGNTPNPGVGLAACRVPWCLAEKYITSSVVVKQSTAACPKHPKAPVHSLHGG